jgi:hypothetical protein
MTGAGRPAPHPCLGCHMCRKGAARLLCYGAIAFGLVDLAIFLYPLGYPALWPAVAGMIIVGLPGALTLAG